MTGFNCTACLRQRRPLFFCLVLSINLISFKYGMNLLSDIRIPPIVLSDFERAVKLIASLHTKSTSIHGLKYRSLICTVVRNDPHLMEFLIRNLITGFSHIVVYDNNRIDAGYDMNISDTLAPFIAAKMVTHVSWHQNTTALLTNGDKVIGALECIGNYEKHADWIAYLDTDEYLYYQHKNASVDTLDDLLVKLERNKTCAARVPMTMMYGEAKLLKPNRTLFEAYPRICSQKETPKVLARPKYTEFNIPHVATCRSKKHIVRELSWKVHPKTALIHYYSKSVQEYLEKTDKSMPPHIRTPVSSYDDGPTCELAKFQYLSDYGRRFLTVYQRLNAPRRFKSVELMPSPRINATLMTTNENDLYNELKSRCGQGHEFDNEKYVAMNPAVKKAIENRQLVDGLYHFMANYTRGAKGCWKTATKSFCE